MIHLFHFYLSLGPLILLDFAEDPVTVVEAAEYDDDDVAPEDVEDADTECAELGVHILGGREEYSGEM